MHPYPLTGDELARLDGELAVEVPHDEAAPIDDDVSVEIALEIAMSADARYYVTVLDAALVRIDREDIGASMSLDALLGLRERVAR